MTLDQSQALSQAQADSAERMNTIPATIMGSIETYSTQVQKQMQGMNSICTNGVYITQCSEAKLSVSGSIRTISPSQKSKIGRNKCNVNRIAIRIPLSPA